MNGRILLFLAALAATPATTTFAQFGGHHYQRDTHRNYDHARTDARLNANHYGRDMQRNYDHARSDLYRYGTTNPYSSPGHFFNDVRRQQNHYRADQHRNYDHAVRDQTRAIHHYQRDSRYGQGH